MAKKKYTTDNGSRCSGYGIYPDGRKCKGCSDCEGKYLRRAATYKQLKKTFDKSHTVLRIETIRKKKK